MLYIYIMKQTKNETMKAIVHTKKGSAYSKYNGQTFTIDEIMSNGNKMIISLEIPDDNGGWRKVDFAPSEITIVMIREMIESFKYHVDHSTGHMKPHFENVFDALKKYVEIKKIEL